MDKVTDRLDGGRWNRQFCFVEGRVYLWVNGLPKGMLEYVLDYIFATF